MTIGNMFDRAQNAVAIIFNEDEDTHGIHVNIAGMEKQKMSQAMARLIKNLKLDMEEPIVDYATISFLEDHNEEDSDNVC